VSSTVASSIKVLRHHLATALRQGRWDDAATILAHLDQEDPLAVETRGGHLELLLKTRRLNEAEALAERLVAEHPRSPRILYLAGRVAYAQRAYELAAEHFRESLRAGDHWTVRRWLGKTLTQLGELDEAEAHLLQLSEDHPVVGRDLAWLYERRGDTERARATLEQLLRRLPDDELAKTQRERLIARQLPADKLASEVEMLAELGEEVSPQLVAEHLERLAEHGELRRLREGLAQHIGALSDTEIRKVAWACHRSRMPDLAYDLFVRTFERNMRSWKFLTALETDARRAGKVAELIALYREHAPQHRPLYGRAIRLERSLET
jgi:tetratricopeptide (TPR) repeat protein